MKRYVLRNLMFCCIGLIAHVQTEAQVLIDAAGGTLTDLTPDGVTVNSFEGNKWSNNGVEELNGNLFFVATDAVSGQELWMTDGTVDGTMLLRDIASGTDSSFVNNTLVVGNYLYFTADDGAVGNELWRTDGTSGGTERVIDLYAGEASSNPTGLTEFKGKILFSAIDEDSDAFAEGNRNLWITDGTAEGTQRLSSPTENGVTPLTEGDAEFLSPFQITDSLAFFVGNDGIKGNELWVTNGEREPWGTHLVLDIDTTSVGGIDGGTLSAGIQWLFASNEKQVVFRASTHESWTDGQPSDATLGTELWVSDGSIKGTYFIGDYSLDADPNNPEGSTRNSDYAFPFNYKGRTYFRAYKSVVQVEPASTNLTKGDLELLTDLLSIWPDGNNYPSWIQRQFIFDDLMFMFGRSAGNENDPPGRPRANYELYVSDGTDLGTVIAADINVGTGPSWPSRGLEVNDRIYFTASDLNNQTGHDVWAIDKKGDANDPALPEGTNLSELEDYYIYKVVDDVDGIQSAIPHDLINIDEVLYFISIEGKLMKYDDGIESKVSRDESTTDFGPDPTTEVNDLVNGTPIVSITGPATGSSYIELDDISFTLSVMDDSRDASGGISKVELFDFGGSVDQLTLLKEVTSEFSAITLEDVPAGIYNVLAVATDNEGAITYSSPVAIRVEGNVLPIISITNPTANQEIIVGDDIGLGVNVSDPDGNAIIKVEYYNGETLLGEVSESPYGLLIESPAIGSYSFTARAFDANGGETTSEAVAVTVVEPPLGIEDNLESKPTIYPNPVINSITLDGKAEVLASLMSYRILDNSGKLIRTENMKEYIINVSQLQEGQYFLVLTDDSGKNGLLRFIKR